MGKNRVRCRCGPVPRTWFERDVNQKILLMCLLCYPLCSIMARAARADGSERRQRRGMGGEEGQDRGSALILSNRETRTVAEIYDATVLVVVLVVVSDDSAVLVRHHSTSAGGGAAPQKNLYLKMCRPAHVAKAAVDESVSLLQ